MTDSRFAGERTKSQEDLGEELVLATNEGSLTSNGCDGLSAQSTIQQMRERNSRVPINQLPTELLAIIFHTSLETVENRFKGLQMLAGVAWLWQNIVKGTPGLWAVLDWRITVEHLPVFIQRSKGAPLKFTMDENRSSRRSLQNSTPDAAALLDMVLPELARWEEGRLIFKYGQLDRRGSLERPAPLLKAFHLSYYTRIDDLSAQREPQVDLFQGHAPNLVELTIIRLPVRWNSAIFRNLLSIWIADISSNGPTVQEVLQFILSSPRLQSLSLGSVALSPGPFPQEILPIEIPHLKKLVCSNLSFSHTEFVLSRIRAPALRRLVVDPQIDGGCDPLVGFFNAALLHLKPVITSSISNAQELRILVNGRAGIISVTTDGSFDRHEGIRLLFHHQPAITGLQLCLEFMLRNVPVCPLVSLFLNELHAIPESNLFWILDSEINDKVTELSIAILEDDSLLVFLCKARYLGGVAKWVLPKLRRLVLRSLGGVSNDRIASLLRHRYAPDPRELSTSLMSDPRSTTILEAPDRLELLDLRPRKLSSSDFDNLSNVVGAGVIKV